MGISNILIEKPSRIHNLSYFILGYYLTTLLSFDLEFTLADRIFLITFLGGFVGTIIFYIKPIERCISTYYKITKQNEARPDEIVREFSFPVYKSEILFSKYLNDERVIINGAFFLGIGLLFSNNILIKYELEFLYSYSLIFSLILILAGLWEIHTLINRKMKTLVFFYTFYNDSKQIPALSQALEAKDWIKAEKISEGEIHLWDPDLYMSFYGSKPISISICPKCSEKKKGDVNEYCTECGTILISQCPNCSKYLAHLENAPKYCKYCGVDIYEFIINEKKGNSI